MQASETEGILATSVDSLTTLYLVCG